MLGALQNAMRLPDLRRKILFTLFILVIYRVAAHIPVPGVDLNALETVFNPANANATSGLLSVMDIFSGGALSNFSVVAMGVYPYITASIIMQLLTPLIPSLQAMQKEGDQGRRRINQITHWITIPLAFLQGIGQATIMANTSPPVLPTFNAANLLNPTSPLFLSTWAIMVTLVAGTMFALWLGELISEQGVGSGVSIIIFGGIVAAIPTRIIQLATQSPITLIVFLIITLITVVGIVYLQEGQRRIPVQYGKRVRGMKVYGGGSTYIPLRVNSAGMIPLIFAISILIFPGLIASWFQNSQIEWLRNFATAVVNLFSTTGWVYAVTYFLLVIAFTFFYTYIIFQQQNLSETLQNQGGFIPGIRPGPSTTKYLNNVVMRITIIGALGLGIIALLPFLERFISGTDTQTLIVSSTGLLIVVGVVLDTMKQLEAQLMMRHYEGFIR
ncbi:MAG: preprotein translocase subunit SecY [Chloroflexota bacterium]|nr:MAG: preprotein translocase subunit SecY [Chloroflexota bacterium]